MKILFAQVRVISAVIVLIHNKLYSILMDTLMNGKYFFEYFPYKKTSHPSHIVIFSLWLTIFQNRIG